MILEPDLLKRAELLAAGLEQCCREDMAAMLCAEDVEQVVLDLRALARRTAAAEARADRLAAALEKARAFRNELGASQCSEQICDGCYSWALRNLDAALAQAQGRGGEE